jgi:hypothetical protein
VDVGVAVGAGEPAAGLAPPPTFDTVRAASVSTLRLLKSGRSIGSIGSMS